MTQRKKQYRVIPGPEGLLPPAAAIMGVRHPKPGEGLLEGVPLAEDEVMEEIARKILTRRNPTLFPGPLLVWGWNRETIEKASAVMEMAKQIPGARIITMPDYRPIYPKIDPEVVLSPCHPNLTIWHNNIEACMLIDGHCHFVNVTLKIIRAGTNCYTITLCGNDIHEDSMSALGSVDIRKIRKLTKTIIRVRDGGSLTPWAYTPEGREEIRRSPSKKMFVIPPEDVRDAVSKNRSDNGQQSPEFAHELERGLDENEE
jgi:hypothetical protein